jgi:hypothetical protein
LSALSDLSDHITALEGLELEARHASLLEELTRVAGEVRRVEGALSEQNWEPAHRQLEIALKALAQRVDETAGSISVLPTRINAIAEQLSVLSTLIDETKELSSRLSKIETTLASPTKTVQTSGEDGEPAGSREQPTRLRV